MKKLHMIIKVLFVMFVIVGCSVKQPNNETNNNQDNIITNDPIENDKQDNKESIEDENVEQQDKDNLQTDKKDNKTDKIEDNNKENKKEEDNKEQVNYQLNKTKLELYVGDTYNLKVVNYTGSIKWSSSNNNIASIVNGKIIAINKGKATITASFNNTKLTCQITINEKEVVSNPKLNKTSITLTEGDTYQLKVADHHSSITWKALSNGVADGSIITVSENGLVKAISAGKGVVYASVDGKELLCKVTVNAKVEINVTDECYAMAKEAFALHNEERAKAGLSTLKWNDELYECALIRAKECVESFSHTRPNGESCFSVIKTEYAALGENLAMGHKSAQQVMEGWMNSEGHKSNIINPKYTSMAVACYRENGKLYWAAFFAGKKL